MLNKVLCILTTYKREQKLRRFLLQFDHRFSSFCDFFEIYVADDDPHSCLDLEDIISSAPINIRYYKNQFNLGQGINHVQAAKSNPNFNYFWFPGDDDFIIVDQFLQVLTFIKTYQPTIAAFEFRQGPNLSFGTNFSGDPRLDHDLNSIIDALNSFGKCTSTIIKNPGTHFIDYLLHEFKNCMYQDKAMGAYSVFSDSCPVIYIHPFLTAYADNDYGKLRYSTRVFSNLILTTSKVLSYYNKLHNSNLTVLLEDSPSPVWWWRWGLRATLTRGSDIKYSFRKFLFELFFGFFVAVYFDFKDDFQPP